MIRGVVVDDQPLARAGMAMPVNTEGDIAVVDEAADGAVKTHLAQVMTKLGKPFSRCMQMFARGDMAPMTQNDPTRAGPPVC